jgi:phage terminase large subunit
MADAVREVVIPYFPRAAFLPLHQRRQRWGAAVCHRRAGKTVSTVNELIKAALTCPLPEPRFAYLAPFRQQAKDIAWGYLKRFAAPIPGVEFNESELRVDLPNGGRVRLYGADNYEALRGLYYDGVVLDEFGDMDPRAWAEVIRPALSDRQGWALFIGTPKGRNHFAELLYGDADGKWCGAVADPEWWTMILKASESGLLPDAELRDARKTMSEDQYAAEYECSFDAAVVGAYYGREMQATEAEGRVTRVPWEPRVPVHTAWDLGIGDSTAIWFCQRVNREWLLIDYLENSGVGLDWYVKELNAKPYTYGECILPHDAAVKELGTGRSRVETLESLGVRRIRVMGQRRKEDSINGVRLILPQCWFDRDKTRRGAEALRNYRREYDDKRKVFHDRPLHDWSSHPADAFAELAAADPQNETEWKPINFDDKYT